ncbi:MAG: 1-hydroxycarotenoid 3,4-desaturase CrtD [Marinoscillum sp.]
MPDKKVAIIGAGIAGIGCAIRLRQQGHQVQVFEAAPTPGGKLSEIQLGPYRFDAGPSLFTLPELVDELFQLCGENPKDHFTYRKLDISCKYFYTDSTQITAWAKQDKLVDEIANKTHEAPENIQKAIRNSANLYSSLSKLFMFSALQDWRTFFSRDALKAYLKIPQLGFFNTMNGANQKLFDDPRVVQLFNRYATYNGSSPYKTPSTMNIIPHLEMSLGAYFPDRGMYSITQALVDLAVRNGVGFHYNAPVEQISITDKKVRGIVVKDQEIPFDAVVSNMDIVNSYKKLMPDLKPPRFLLDQPKSSSALIFYWGIKQTFRELDVHNIFFSEDYKNEFEQIFDQGTISADPTVYVHISSKMNPTDAPENGENWFAMINTPNNQGQDWDTLIREARANIIQKLSKALHANIEDLIEVEDVLDPRKIELKTSSALGALYGNSSNNLFAAFLRHANVSRRVKGLYFCGGSVHPGGGIPMSLSSAKLVAKYFL